MQVKYRTEESMRSRDCSSIAANHTTKQIQNMEQKQECNHDRNMIAENESRVLSYS